MEQNPQLVFLCSHQLFPIRREYYILLQGMLYCSYLSRSSNGIIFSYKHVVFADANLLPFATNHRMISFTLYIIGFMGFVMSLKKGYLKQQFGLFCWVHMSLLLIVVSRCEKFFEIQVELDTKV